MQSLGLMLGKKTIKENVEIAKWADDAGFSSVFAGEGRLANDAVVMMSLIAANTSRVKIGSGILPYRTRNVGLLAVTFKDLDQLAPGRMVMGLGGWWEPLATRLGLANRKPLLAMREIITVARALLDGKAITFHGEFVNVEDIRFDSDDDDDARAYPVQIMIGAVRMGMVSLAGEIADGVLLDFLVPPAYTATALDAARRGCELGGRDPAAFEVPQLIATAADDADPDYAIRECKAFFTQYLAQQSHITEFCGADPDLIAAVKAEVSWPTTQATIRRAMEIVPDDLVQSICACGTTSETLEMLERYVDAGCTTPVITPIGERQLETLETIRTASGLH